jgi:hypothetical protein
MKPAFLSLAYSFPLFMAPSLFPFLVFQLRSIQASQREIERGRNLSNEPHFFVYVRISLMRKRAWNPIPTVMNIS